MGEQGFHFGEPPDWSLQRPVLHARFTTASGAQQNPREGLSPIPGLGVHHINTQQQSTSPLRGAFQSLGVLLFVSHGASSGGRCTAPPRRQALFVAPGRADVAPLGSDPIGLRVPAHERQVRLPYPRSAGSRRRRLPMSRSRGGEKRHGVLYPYRRESRICAQGRARRGGEMAVSAWVAGSRKSFGEVRIFLGGVAGLCARGGGGGAGGAGGVKRSGSSSSQSLLLRTGLGVGGFCGGESVGW